MCLRAPCVLPSPAGEPSGKQGCTFLQEGGAEYLLSLAATVSLHDLEPRQFPGGAERGRWL